jgi:hypothetical protein
MQPLLPDEIRAALAALARLEHQLEVTRGTQL